MGTAASPATAYRTSILRLIAITWFICALAVVAEYPFGGFNRYYLEQRWIDQLVYAVSLCVLALLCLRISRITLKAAGISLAFLRRPAVTSLTAGDSSPAERVRATTFGATNN